MEREEKDENEKGNFYGIRSNRKNPDRIIEKLEALENKRERGMPNSHGIHRRLKLKKGSHAMPCVS